MSTKPRSTVSDKRPSTKGTAVPLRRSARLIEKRAREAAKENASGGQGPSDPSSREVSTGIPPTDATLAVNSEPQSVASSLNAVLGLSDEGPDPEPSSALVPVSPESSSQTTTAQLTSSLGTPVPPVNSGVMVVHQRPANELQASVLGRRDPGLGAIVSTARPETGAATVQLEFAPGTMHPSLRTPLEQSTTPIPDTSTFQPAELVTRNAGRPLATSEMTDADMMAYGAVQLERWAKAPPEVVLPADIVYDRRGQGYDMREVDPTRMPLPGTPESGGSSSSDSSYEPSSSDDDEPGESVSGIGVPYPQTGGALGHLGSPTPANYPTNANAVMEASALTQRYEEALARLRAEASAQIQLEREEARRREHVMQTQVEEERARTQAEKEKKRKERVARKELKSRAKQVQAKAIQDQRQGDLLALERIAKERAASEAQKRRADEERAQFLVNMQAQLAATQAQAEEAQTRAMAEEAQRAAAYEAQLREMHQRYEQDQANARKAYDDQVEQLRQFRMKPQKPMVESSGSMRAPADVQVPQFWAEPMLKTESQPNVKAKPVVKLAEPKAEKPGAGTREPQA
ncbi:hypothetical protein BBJ28_00022261 [Nothophytophthora sp. Chile5]|nr:hypothetical protein BBJ28_00022261 [Nothophytophthora sp. Chile5]